MREREIIERAEPFYYPGGPVGCVLVHGFTGTPLEMRPVGEFLKQHDYSVMGVRLSGHATSVNAMIRTRYDDWLASVEDGYHMMKSHCDQVFLIGLSMGGVLSLTQAARLPVDGVVAMSSPYSFPVQWVEKHPFVASLMSLFVRSQKKNPPDWFNQERVGDHISYERNPVRSALELVRLLEVMRGELKNITCPALVIHSRDDKYVLPKNAQPLYDGIGSQDKELIWVDNARHVITRDGDTSRVFEPILAFLRQNAKEEVSSRRPDPRFDWRQTSSGETGG